MIDVKEFVENPTAAIDGDTIKGVHILGFKSRNGRNYSKRAVKEAVALYEGKHVYTDHAAGPRKVEDKFGSLCNVSFSEETGLTGDLKFLSTHPMADRVKEDVEKKLGFFGLSHDANVGFDKTDGKTVLMIGEVKSVDIVCDPATTKRIKEELEAEEVITTPAPDIKAMVSEAVAAELSKFKDELKRVQEQTAKWGKPTSAPAPEAPPAPVDYKSFLRA